MSKRFLTQRVKRWRSRDERIKNPDWLNPSQIQLHDVEALDRLRDSKDPECEMHRMIEDLIQHEGNVLIARDTQNMAEGRGSIVGFLAFSIAPVPFGRALIVVETRIEHTAPRESVQSAFHDAVREIATAENVQRIAYLPDNAPTERLVRSSGINEIERVERLDNLLYDRSKAVGDGTPTLVLPKSPARSVRRKT